MLDCVGNANNVRLLLVPRNIVTSQTLSRNLRFLLWRSGLERSRWPHRIRQWVGASGDSVRAGHLLQGTAPAPTQDEVQKLARATGIEVERLLFADLVAEARTNIVEQNLRY